MTSEQKFPFQAKDSGSKEGSRPFFLPLVCSLKRGGGEDQLVIAVTYWMLYVVIKEGERKFPQLQGVTKVDQNLCITPGMVVQGYLLPA